MGRAGGVGGFVSHKTVGVAFSATERATKCGIIEPMSAKPSECQQREQDIVLVAGSTVLPTPRCYRREYAVAEAAELLGVSPGTVRRWADSGKLDLQRDSGGRRVILGPALAQLMRQLARRAATDIGPTAGHSTRNRFSAIVSKVTKDPVMAQVELQAGPFRLMSPISREAADDLGLTAGMVAVASVEATDVTFELPAS